VLQKGEESKVSLFLVRFLRHDGVFLLRLMTHSSNALTTVDLTGALWKNYWKVHPPSCDVTLTGGADHLPATLEARRQSLPGDSIVKRKSSAGVEQLEPVAEKA